MTSQRLNDGTPSGASSQQRSSRSYEINGQWYFELRGGGQQGPFNSQHEMQAELDEFIRLQEEMNQQN